MVLKEKLRCITKCRPNMGSKEYPAFAVVEEDEILDKGTTIDPSALIHFEVVGSGDSAANLVRKTSEKKVELPYNVLKEKLAALGQDVKGNPKKAELVARLAKAQAEVDEEL